MGKNWKTKYFKLNSSLWITFFFNLTPSLFPSLSLSLYIYIYIYIYIHWKGKKEEKYTWWFVYLPTRSEFNHFFNAKYFIEVILVREIIMIDKFSFNWKSSLGFVDLGMWKKNRINTDWNVQIASCHVMNFLLESKWRFVVWETDLWRFISLND